MNEQKNQNGRGIFYGVIGVATLVVAIIGATFAYFTASQSNNNIITGNMASVNFGLKVEPVVNPGLTTGIIPMSNTMVEKAVSNSGKVCKDDNGNAVCQIYKITVSNSSTATMFVDGYVALAGGSGIPTDTTSQKKNKTTMRWAQVFTTDSGATYSTAGDQILGDDDEKVTYATLDAPTANDATGFNATNIKTSASDVVKAASESDAVTISENKYATVKTNFIRTSDHTITAGNPGTSVDTIESTTNPFNRTDDVTSMLVLSQQLQPNDNQAGSGKDEVVYYIVVWLSETGTNQTANASTGTGTLATTNPANANFFNGTVAFLSAQGSEVTATFSGYTAVRSDNAATTATP